MHCNFEIIGFLIFSIVDFFNFLKAPSFFEFEFITDFCELLVCINLLQDQMGAPDILLADYVESDFY